MDPRNDRASSNPQNRSTDRDAAEQVVRDQLEAIYGGQSRVVHPTGARVNPSASQRPQQQAYQPQQQQQNQNPGQERWQEYHSQWQEYYRRYYEQYYVGHLNQVLKEKEEQGGGEDQTPDREEDLSTLRQKIIDNAKKKAKKARGSRHFIPIVSAFVVVFVVLFLQYNQVIIANVQAYVSPGAMDPQNIVIDPSSETNVSSEPRLIIPKINVDVPVVYNVGYDHDSQMAAMEKGVAHFSIPGANSIPGQLGNTVFSGHSSNDLFDPGDYKFIFAQLDKLTQGDTIYVNYNSIRYTYTVTKMEVVKPTNVQSLFGMDDKPHLTLITCTPLGTATNRLLVKAEQVAPDPSKATAPGASNEDASGAQMVGNGPSALERLFGAR